MLFQELSNEQLILQISEGVLLRAHLADAVLQPRHVRADGLHAEEEQRPLAEGGHQPQHHQEKDRQGAMRQRGE